jgi:hypothetical protein
MTSHYDILKNNEIGCCCKIQQTLILEKRIQFLLKERSHKHNNFNCLCTRIIYIIVLCCFKTIFVFQRGRELSYSHCDVICWTAVLCIVVRVSGYCGERKLCCPKQTDSLLLFRTMEHEYLQPSFSRVQPATPFSFLSQHNHTIQTGKGKASMNNIFL